MNPHALWRRLIVSCCAGALGLGAISLVPGLSPALRPAVAAETDTVQPAVGKPLQEAQKQIAAQHYPQALVTLRQIDKIPGKTPYEILLTEEMRGLAAKGAGDTATALKSFALVVASPHLAPAQRLRFIQELAVIAYAAKDYATATQWLQRYAKDGGTDPQVTALLGQSYYLAGDYAAAAREFQAQNQAEIRVGRRPTENQLLLLLDCQTRLKDAAGHGATLEQLAADYPKPAYWSELLQGVAQAPGFAQRLDLDRDRLALALGLMKSADDYMEMAQLALEAGLPGEAQSVLAKGYAAGILGSGSEAPRQARLKELAAKTAATDRQTLDRTAAQAEGGREGTALVNAGLDEVGYGAIAKGLPLMEQGIAKGGSAHPDDDRLHLGFAYLLAGQKAKAVAAFRGVQGADGSAALARLWILYATQPS